VISRRTRVAAAALAAAAIGAFPRAGIARGPDPLERLDLETESIEERLSAAERFGLRPEEPPGVHAQRRFEDGQLQYQLGDWLHAAVMLTEAVDAPVWAEAADRDEATFLLADALRRQDLCGAARVRYQDYLGRPDAAHRTEAIAGALECAVKERRHADVEGLLALQRSSGAAAPPEVLYLLAKGAFQRTDVPAAERIARATEAFEKVGPPFQLQAWYFEGVLRIEEQNYHQALQWFERCARAEAKTDKDVEVRDLCMLALGRVHTQMGDTTAAIGWYAAVPWTSPRFADAAYETALAYVRAKKYDDALRMTSFIPELEPDSPLAPEAMVVKGHLLLRLGRYAEATETYNVVINTYAPVRDEIDAILAMGEDPLRYYDELIGRPGNAFEVAPILPPVAVRWATTSREVSTALGFVRAVDSARADVAEARDVAVRLEALLERGGGIDAFATLQRAYAHAQAVENAAAKAEGAYVAAAADAAERALQPERRGELLRARQARAEIERRFDAMPRTPQATEERLAHMRARVDQVGEAVYRLDLLQRGCLAAIEGIDGWLDKNRAEIHGDDEARQDVVEELRRQRAIVEEYDSEIADARQAVAAVRDAAGGVEQMVEESRIRADYLAAVEVQRGAVEAARGSVPATEREAFERMDRGRARLAEVRTRARALKLGVAAEATRRSDAVRARIAAERIALAGQEGALEGVLQGARDVLGEIAVRSIADVRGMFYRIVLKADVGVVDVAWSRKRARLEKIQALAIQKDAEVQQLDKEFRSLAREVE
jgi:tetratricopeptide (TPR) repeat protein